MNKQELLDYLDTQLAGIVKRPLMYGGTLEGVELMFIVHLNFRNKVLGIGEDINKKWQSFVCQMYPDKGAAYVSSILKNMDDGEAKLVALMNYFLGMLNR